MRHLPVVPAQRMMGLELLFPDDRTVSFPGSIRRHTPVPDPRTMTENTLQSDPASDPEIKTPTPRSVPKPKNNPSASGEPPRANSYATGPSEDDPTAAHTAGPAGDRVLGEFRLLRRLGSGGMADVYLAEQTSLKRHVAVKILHSRYLSDETYLQRFEQEAKTAGGLSHPNIVQVLVIGQDGPTHYIAQEYVQGINLREFINRKGPPGARTALHLMKQVAAALQAASEANIVHRDVKPENIMITRKGEVKITDFGLALLTQEEERLNLTQVGVTMGTPLYMSPEQVNGRPLDHRSDIYSFGVTCYHMLAGRPPFHGESAITIAVQHLNENPEPLWSRRPDLPRRLCELVHKAMAKNPKDRYQDARSLLRDLTRIEGSLGNVAAPLDWDDFAPESFKEGWINRVRLVLARGGSRRILAIAGSALLVLGLGALAGWMTRPADPREAPPHETTVVAKQPTVLDQFILALKLNTVEAWQAVGTHYPNERPYVQRAREQLALLHLRNYQLDEAERLFREFTLNDQDEALQAKGWAGLAILATYRQNYAESSRIIALELGTLRSKLDGTLESQLRDAIRVNQQHGSRAPEIPR